MGDKPKILLVDDEPGVLSLFCVTLESYFEVVCANDGVEAYELFQKNEFPLVVTDIKMPNKDGVALAHQVQQLKPATRILFVSGHLDDLNAYLAFNSGMYCLPKPIEPTLLMLAARYLWQDYQQNPNSQLQPQGEIDHSLPIVLAEDHDGLRKLYSTILGTEFNNIIDFPDGALALEWFQSNPGKAAVLFTDLEMPHLDGIKLATQVRDISPLTQIVTISGALDDAKMLKLLSMGIPALPKPVDPSYVKLCACHCLAHYQILQQG